MFLKFSQRISNLNNFHSFITASPIIINNISYTLAVFVKDFKGNESQASQYVAHISAVVYSLLMQTSVKS